MGNGTKTFGTVVLGLFVAYVCTSIAVMLPGRDETFDMIAFPVLIMLIIICTGIILAKLDKISRKLDEKKTDEKKEDE